MQSRNYNYVGHIADQIKFLFLGISFFFVLGLTSNSILPVVFDINQFNGIGPSLSLIAAGFILFIIGKYHFLDLSLIIQRGFIYSILITGIIGIYLSILFILEMVFHQSYFTNPAISGILTFCILNGKLPKYMNG